MKSDSKVEVLRSMRLFSGCTKRELASIDRLCTLVFAEKGFVLTTQGAPGRECFVIADGEASVTISGRPVATVGAGECVGEMSLLDGGRRTATVTALTEMTVLALGGLEFRSLLAASPQISRNMMVSLARRLREAEAEQPV